MRLLSILTAATLAMIGTSAFAQVSAPAISAQTMGARIAPVIKLEKLTAGADGNGNDLYFCQFTFGQTGNVQLIPTLIPTRAVDASLLPINIGTGYEVPKYKVTATTGTNFKVAIKLTGGTSVDAVVNGASKSMGVSKWQITNAAGAAADFVGGSYTLDVTSAVEFSLGATLAIKSDSPVAKYQGTYNITATWE